MRELITDARNIRHSVVTGSDGDGNAIITRIEAVLTVMTRKMQFSGSGLLQTEDLETVRFDMSIVSAKKLIKDIQQWVEDAEKEREILTVADAVR
jgi:hypothetical protein